MTRRDWITDVGIGVVGLAAAVLTFTTLSALGVAVGFGGELFGWFRLAWLLPIVIDAAGIVAARVWLRGRGGPEVVDYARKLALCCIGLSVVFNGTWHLIELGDVTPAPWWVVLPVTSVPPAVLAAAVHLGHLLSRTAETGETAGRTAEGVQTVETLLVNVRTAGPDTPVPAVGPAETDTGRPEIAAGETAGPTEGEDMPGQAADQPGQGVSNPGPDPVPDSPDPLLPEVIRWAQDRGPDSLSQRAVRAEFHVGGQRSADLVAAAREAVR